MEELKHHPAYKPSKDCNGCGSGWNEKLVPDTIFFLSIRRACCIHDDRYSRGGVEANKELADIEFLENMLTIIDNYKRWWYPHFLARHRAMSYYDAVVRAGSSSFNYKGIIYG